MMYKRPFNTRVYVVIGLVLFLSACKPTPQMKEIDVQGHRGCRGHMPENSIPGFIKAIEMGVHTLELDVCISKDSLVVVSHEPWLSVEICDLEGEEITEQNQMEFNLFKLNYEEIKKADCGSKFHARFPNQEKVAVYKPLLSEVIEEVKKYCKLKNIAVPNFNVEAKLSAEGDDVYHPKPEAFAELLVAVIKNQEVEKTTTLQSFDFRILKVFHQKWPEFTLAALVENSNGVDENLAKLGFKPHIYSPYFKLISLHDVQKLQKEGIKVIPWTVNELQDIESTLSLGVDGIISDYPLRVFEVLEQVKSR
jgi:glycerophosphoryl diester phosphodiesterase